MDVLEKLESRIPIATDKALINLVNGIQINHELISYQKDRGFFGTLFDQLAGKDRKRQLLLNGNLISGQQVLHDWVLELTNSLQVSQVALEVTQSSLLEARSVIRKQKEIVSTHQKELTALSESLNSLSHEIKNKINTMEERLHTIELSISAQRDFEQIVTAWEAKLTYTDLPLLIQIIMLATEVFSSSVVAYELQTRDTKTYRKLLVNRILVAANEFTQAKFFGLVDLLDLTLEQLSISNDLELSLGILAIHTLPYSSQQRMPHLFTTVTALELARLAQDIRPTNPGRCAVEICRSKIQKIDYTTTMPTLLTNIAHEVASHNLSVVSNYVTT